MSLTKHIYSNNNDYIANLDKLVNTVGIFNGIIYGDFISQYYFEKNILGNNLNIDFENINIIFYNYNDSISFLRLLKTLFEIYNRNCNSQNYFKILLNYNYQNKDYSKVKNLNIFLNVNFINLNFYTYYLDINLISLQNGGLNLIKYENSENNYIKFSSILNRIINKKFSFIDKNYSYNIFNNIDICIQLILNGWIMDDYYLKNETSVIFLWKNVNNNIRTSFKENDLNKLKSGNLCSICSSEFKDNDLVINTKCNHNYHWKCDNCDNNNSGIKNWISKFSHKCPICRCEYCI
jgi:hypothetical protein